MKKIIINCDDFGATKKTNLAITEALKKNKASSASILSNGKYFNHAISQIKKHTKNNFFGIHLNLTEGKSLCKSKNNLLTDNQYNFKNKPEFFFLANHLSIKKKLKKSIYLEFKEQILNIKKRGIKISHFDSHQHIHHVPFINEIIKKLAKEFKIKKISYINEKFIVSNFFKNFIFKFFSNNYLKFLLIKIYQKKITYFKSSDYFFGILNSGKIDINELFKYIDSIDNNKTIELCIHPSFLNKKKDDNKYHKFYTSINRDLERKILFSNIFKINLDKRKIKLISFKSL